MNNGAFQSLIGHGTPKRGGEKRGKSALPCSDGPSKDNCKECCTMQCAWCSIRLRLTDDMSTMTCQQRAQSTSQPCSVHRCQYHRNRSSHVHTGWPKKWSLSTRLTVLFHFCKRQYYVSGFVGNATAVVSWVDSGISPPNFIKISSVLK